MALAVHLTVVQLSPQLVHCYQWACNTICLTGSVVVPMLVTVDQYSYLLCWQRQRSKVFPAIHQWAWYNAWPSDQDRVDLLQLQELSYYQSTVLLHYQWHYQPRILQHRFSYRHVREPRQMRPGRRLYHQQLLLRQQSWFRLQFSFVLLTYPNDLHVTDQLCRHAVV